MGLHFYVDPTDCYSFCRFARSIAIDTLILNHKQEIDVGSPHMPQNSDQA